MSSSTQYFDRLKKQLDLPDGAIAEQDIALVEKRIDLFFNIREVANTKRVKGNRKKVSLVIAKDKIIVTRKESTFNPCCSGSGVFFSLSLAGLNLSTVKNSFKIVITSNSINESCYWMKNHFKPDGIEQSFLTKGHRLKLIFLLPPEAYKRTLGAFHSALKENSVNIKPSNSIIEKLEKPKDIFQKLMEWYSIQDGVRQGSVAKPKESNGYIQCINVLQEILTSERLYVCDLSTLVNSFMIPLSAYFSQNQDLVSELRAIFSNLGAILNVNAELLKALTDDVNRINAQEKYPSFEMVADIFATQFLKHMDFLKMYSVYCHQYQENIVNLCEIRRKKKDVDIQISISETKTGKPLQSLLIKPVQRICKYPLLFRELFKTIKCSNMLRENDIFSRTIFNKISKTCESLEKITSSVNSRVQDIENQKHILKIFYELGGQKDPESLQDFIKPTRVFKSSSEILLRDMTNKANNKRFSCVLYLFNDLLVIGKLTQSILGRQFSQASANSSRHLLPTSSSHHKSTSNINKAFKQKAKIIYNIAFDKYRIRVRKNVNSDNVDKQKRCPFRIVASQRKSVGNKVETVVEQFEVWCESEEKRDSLSLMIAEEIHNFRKEKENLATQKLTLDKRLRANELKNNPVLSLREKRALEVTAESSLSMLADKYHRQRSSYTVIFEDGILGLSFSNTCDSLNGEAVRGVFVAIVSDNGQAKRKGVRVGDKLVRINTTIVKDSATWQQVFNVLKKVQRPVTISFMRVELGR